MIQGAGAEAVGVGSIVNRSGLDSLDGAPLRSLVALSLAKYRPEECPLCKAGGAPVKPGSRDLGKGKA